MKKILAMILAIVMLMALATTASAAPSRDSVTLAITSA